MSTTTERTYPCGSDQCAVDSLADIDQLPHAACPKCERLARHLNTARSLYGNVTWAVTPEGILQEITHAA